MTKYTKDVAAVFHMLKPPHPGFIVDVIEYPGHVALRFYPEDAEKFSDGQKVSLMEYLYKLRDNMRAVGCPTELEPHRGNPPPN